MTKKRKLWIPIVSIVLVAALVGGAIAIWKVNTGKAVEVYPVSNISDSYWGDSTTLSGNVSTGKVQNVALQDSLIQSINVSAGDTVSAGDVLMVYDTTSFQLTLQSDQAKIAVLENSIRQANQNITKYKNLKPSELAPKPTEEIIDHGPLNILSTVDAGQFSGDGQVFQCSGDTVVTASLLQQLRATGASVEFQLYDGNTLYGSWIVDGTSLPYTRTEYLPVETATPTPDPDQGTDTPTDQGGQTTDQGGEAPDQGSQTPDQGGEIPDQGSQETTPPADGSTSSATSSVSASAQTVYTKVEVEALDTNWTLGGSLMFTGDGVSVDLSAPQAGYGQFVSCTPTEYQQFETVYHENFIPDGSENYMYSKEELAKMIKEAEQELATLQLDLRSAQLTYEQNQLVSKTGEVTANISGTVTDVKDPATLATGDTLITVKGTENYTVTAYISELNLNKVSIGDILSVYAYQSSNNVTATVSEIGTTPASGSFGWGSENPNNSYYPITATVDDPNVELTIGEWCDITLMSGGDSAGSDTIYLSKMYVRSDDGGSYVMMADENNRLKKQYVRTGKTIWGSSIEIRSGVTREDRIAFPYGKTVREGAKVTDADYPKY